MKEPKRQQKIISSEKVDVTDDMTAEDTFAGKCKILVVIKMFFFQNLTGIGTFLIGIAAIFALIFKVIIPNTIGVELKLTGEDISNLVESKKSEDTAQLIEFLRKVERDPKVPIMERAIASAFVLGMTGKSDDAIEKWSSIANIAEGTDDNIAAAAWFVVGCLHTKKGEREKANSAYDKTIHLDPSFFEAYNNRGVIKFQLGQYEWAIADYDEAIRLKPDLAKAYNNRGKAKYYLNLYASALVDYNQAIRLMPSDVEVYFNRGTVKYHLHQYNEAIADYNMAIGLKPNYADAYSNRGTAKVMLNQHQSAIADYDEAIRIEPDNADTYYNRASVKVMLGQFKSGFADYDQAIRLRSDFAEVYHRRGLVKSLLGQYESALVDCNKAIQIEPDNPHFYMSRAVMKILSDPIEDGNSDFQTALNLAEQVRDESFKIEIEQLIQRFNGSEQTTENSYKTQPPPMPKSTLHLVQ